MRSEGSAPLGTKFRAMKLDRVILLFLALTGIVWADGLFVPQAGGGVVLDGRSLQEQKRLKLEGEEVPLAAVHSAAPVLATLTEKGGLVFWNLPDLVEASRHESPLFSEGIVELEFSLAGDKLYLLSSELNAVVVFDLEKSEVSGVLPVPGSRPLGLEVARQGLLVRQSDGVVLLSPQLETGLLAQFRLPGNLLATTVMEGELCAVTDRNSGAQRFRLSDGKPLELLAGGLSLKSIAAADSRNLFFLLSRNGGLESRSFSSESSLWSSPLGEAFDRLVYGGAGETIYALNQETGSVVAVEARNGAIVSRTRLESPGVPVVFGGL